MMLECDNRQYCRIIREQKATEERKTEIERETLDGSANFGRIQKKKTRKTQPISKNRLTSIWKTSKRRSSLSNNMRKNLMKFKYTFKGMSKPIQILNMSFLPNMMYKALSMKTRSLSRGKHSWSKTLNSLGMILTL